MIGYREGLRRVEALRFAQRPWWTTLVVVVLAILGGLTWASAWFILAALVAVALVWALRPRVALELDHDRETLRVQRLWPRRGGFELPFGSITSVACVAQGRDNVLVLRDQDEEAHVVVQGTPTEEDAERLREILAPIRGPR